MKNFHFAVRETKSDVIFLRKIIPGATDKSYGIHVARLAGIPQKVTERADAILSQTIDRTSAPSQKVQRYTQLLLADDPHRAPLPQSDPILDEIRSIQVDEMTPLQALTILHKLKRRIQDGDNP